MSIFSGLNRPFIVFVHDLVMTACGFWLAMYLRLSRTLIVEFHDFEEALAYGTILIVGMSAISYQIFGLYKGIWRYASVEDLLQLIKAVSCATLGFVLLLLFVEPIDPISRSVPLIHWFIVLILLGGPRFLYRALRDYRASVFRRKVTAEDQRIPLLVVGTGIGAEQLIRSIVADNDAAYRVVGVLDEKTRRVGRSLHGVPVLGSLDQFEAVVAGLAEKGVRPQRVILSQGAGELDGAMVRHLLDQCGRLGLTLGRVPSLTEFKEAASGGKIELRPIAIQDLLGRPQAALDLGAINKLIAGRRVLITGAGGTIGSELTRQIAARKPARLVILEHSEVALYTIDLELGERFPDVERARALVDVREREEVLRVFAAHRPELVFHAAALKHVPVVEESAAQGALTNTIGTRNVADACGKYGTLAMVLISTDKAVRPTSVMGATKRFAEAYVQALDVRSMAGGEAGDNTGTRFMTVRFGNVLGSSGSVVPLFQRQLSRGGPLTVTHPEMRRYFMTVEEAVQLVLQASAHGIENREQRGKIFVLDMGEPVKIVDLARQMIRLAGYRPEIDVRIEFTGLRPGEKLFEELLDADESPMPTGDDRVLIAAPRVIDYALINRACQELESAARTADVDRVVTILGNIVPEFRRGGPAPVPSHA